MSSTTQQEEGNDSNKRSKKGAWSAEEDAKLEAYVQKYKGGNWNTVSKNTGFGRCGKSCRLRWLNHLNPSVTKGHFKKEEVTKFFELYNKFGGFKWSKMARELHGRSDNAIKNFWNARKRKHEKLGTSPFPHNIRLDDGESCLRGSSSKEQNRNLFDFSNNQLPKFDDDSNMLYNNLYNNVGSTSAISNHTVRTFNDMGSFGASPIPISMVNSLPPLPQCLYISNMDYPQNPPPIGDQNFLLESSRVHSSEIYADEKGKTTISLGNNVEADHGQIAEDAYFDYDLYEKNNNKKGKEPISLENHFEANHADVINPDLWVDISELLVNDDDYNSHDKHLPHDGSIDPNLLFDTTMPLDTCMAFYHEMYKQLP